MKDIFEISQPSVLIRKSKSLAILDAIFCQDWEFRYFSHNSKWAPHQEMGSMRDGEGNDYFILFNESGAAIKGCYLDGGGSGNENLIKEVNLKIPEIYLDFKTEPAFSISEASFVCWFDRFSGVWQKLDGINNEIYDDGYEYLTKWLREGSDFYKVWAEEYYEKNIDLSLVKDIFDFNPLDISLIKSINIEIDENLLLEDIKEIGYPYVSNENNIG